MFWIGVVVGVIALIIFLNALDELKYQLGPHEYYRKAKEILGEDRFNELMNLGTKEKSIIGRRMKRKGRMWKIEKEGKRACRREDARTRCPYVEYRKATAWYRGWDSVAS